MVSFSMTLSDP